MLRNLFGVIRSLTPTCISCRCISEASKLASDSQLKYDVVVVGGGIVGCATARQIKMSNPEMGIALVEKEDQIARHQSGNNSGVLHAGIYYAPGSLKAKLCVKGIDMAYDYFDRHSIPYKRIGKLIVAVEPEEVPRLETLFQRAQKNNCKLIQLINGDEIKKYAPHCKASGLKAIWSPHTGIVDWGLVTRSFAEDFEKRGGKVYINYSVDGIHFANESVNAGTANDFPVVLQSKKNKNEIRCKYLVTCAGLQSDRVAALSGCSSIPKIVPFRGEYLLLKPNKHNLVNTNIYPVPDDRFPFLGVHFTPRMDGNVWLGPNAVLAYKREGYKYSDISLRDLYDAVTFKGMRKLMWKYLGFGVKEMYRGIIIRAQVKQLQRYIPQLTCSDVTRGPAGVRAQAMDEAGSLIQDFVFDSGSGQLSNRILHVRNAPSPGATSSLAIAEMIGGKAAEKFGLKHKVA
uniref:L-2-hydroxyglutarate dehydrogenase, mitochondrial n=1 Tax=Syphacia muris TaxID=451379 RepID=A0A0N5AWL4_9BILA